MVRLTKLLYHTFLSYGNQEISAERDVALYLFSSATL